MSNPLYKHSPLKFNTNFLNTKSVQDKLVESLIEKRRQVVSKTGEKSCIVDNLLDSHYSKESLRDEVKGFLFAGHETTVQKFV